LLQSLGLGAAIGMLAATAACGTPRNDLVRNDASNQGTAMTSASDMPAPPGGLPVNKRFAKLDDYLAWLRETQAPIDRPWYEEVAPGSYLLRSGNLRIVPTDDAPSPTEQPVSRAQLMKRFGFTR